MDKLELLEKVARTTGVSFEDAKNALEACNWDALEAVVYLEKEGKTEKKNQNAKTETNAPERPFRPRNSAKPEGSAQDLFHKIGDIIFRSRLVLTNKSGDDSFSVPLFVAVVLFLVAFWIALLVLLIFIFIGYNFKIVLPNETDDQKIRGTLNQTKDNVFSWISATLNKAADSFKTSQKPSDSCEPADSDPAEVLKGESGIKAEDASEKEEDFVIFDEITPEAPNTDPSEVVETVKDEIEQKTASDAEAVFPKDIFDEISSEESNDNPEI